MLHVSSCVVNMDVNIEDTRWHRLVVQSSMCDIEIFLDMEKVETTSQCSQCEQMTIQSVKLSSGNLLLCMSILVCDAFYSSFTTYL